MKETLRTKPSPFCPEPTREQMGEAAEKVGLSRYSPELVKDLYNIASGGEILLPSELRPKVRAYMERSLSKDSWGDYRLKKGGTTNNRQKAVQKNTEYAMNYHQRVSSFLRSVEVEKFPGSTPLEKAMSLLKLLSQQKGGSASGTDGEPLPIFQDNEGSEVANKLNDIMDTVESMSDEESELIAPEVEEGDTKESKDLAKRKIAEEMTSGKDAWLKISRLLDEMPRLRVAKQKKFFADPNGQEVRTRAIKGLHEINKVVSYEWAYTKKYRNYRLVTQQTRVRERGVHEEKRQLLYILVDCSGSMDTKHRISVAGGILMNRLKAVMTGDAEVFFRFFDSSCDTEKHAADIEAAKKLIKEIRSYNFSGGGTAIENCAKEALERIEEIMKEPERKLVKPQLVIVTDGEDKFNLKLEELKGTILHAFVVQCQNTNLTELAAKSGGVAMDKM